jgi:hypothetical protein
VSLKGVLYLAELGFNVRHGVRGDEHVCARRRRVQVRACLPMCLPGTVRLARAARSTVPALHPVMTARSNTVHARMGGLRASAPLAQHHLSHADSALGRHSHLFHAWSDPRGAARHKKEMVRESTSEGERGWAWCARHVCVGRCRREHLCVCVRGVGAG